MSWLNRLKRNPLETAWMWAGGLFFTVLFKLLEVDDEDVWPDTDEAQPGPEGK